MRRNRRYAAVMPFRCTAVCCVNSPRHCRRYAVSLCRAAAMPFHCAAAPCVNPFALPLRLRQFVAPRRASTRFVAVTPLPPRVNPFHCRCRFATTPRVNPFALPLRRAAAVMPLPPPNAPAMAAPLFGSIRYPNRPRRIATHPKPGAMPNAGAAPYGGGDRIRTCGGAFRRSCFQDRRLQPLGHPSVRGLWTPPSLALPSQA